MQSNTSRRSSGFSGSSTGCVANLAFVRATQVAPQLTTLRIPREEIGVTVIRCLALRFGDTERFPPLRIALAPEFIERRSTAPPGSRSWVKRVGTRMLDLSIA
jgi:hypothetical protein